MNILFLYSYDSEVHISGKYQSDVNDKFYINWKFRRFFNRDSLSSVTTFFVHVTHKDVNNEVHFA